ncbi:MAG: restriction endonuclease [Gammaproteobacteria bacterium]|nr:restriction endonuclease [Gammaproteobacteria bacterium]
MLFSCFKCGHLGFQDNCRNCGPDSKDDNVPLNPEYYPEFQYESKGFVKDLFLKKNTEKKLRGKLDAVLQKYTQFENPYFLNYMHLAGRGGYGSDDTLLLFQSVLVRLGFDELQELGNLTLKLVRTTSFRFQYDDFVERTKGRIRSNLQATLWSWIDERGSAFRRDLPMLIYYLWQNNLLESDISFSIDAVPLVSDTEYIRLHSLCETIYFDIKVGRFKTSLENFDPSRYLTMYGVDAMGGYEFEDFLVVLFTTLGYDVQTTKRSGDQGADLFAEKFGKKIVIQAKNYSDNVGNAAVQQVLAAKTFYNCDESMVVTNS